MLNVGDNESIRGSARVSAGLFAMLGVSPIRGRVFLPEEGRAGTEDRVILSETLWRGVFSADPGLVGQTIQIDDRPHLVVGIMPADFRFPNWDTVVWRPIDFFAPAPTLATMLPAVYVRWPRQIPRTDAEARATQVLHATDPAMAKMRAEFTPLVSSNSRDEYYRKAVQMLADRTGTYRLGFTVLAVLAALGSFCFLLARRPPPPRRLGRVAG